MEVMGAKRERSGGYAEVGGCGARWTEWTLVDTSGWRSMRSPRPIEAAAAPVSTICHVLSVPAAAGLLEEVVYLFGGRFKGGSSVRTIQIDGIKSCSHNPVNVAGVVGDRK
jgi:hypothetical protein